MRFRTIHFRTLRFTARLRRAGLWIAAAVAAAAVFRETKIGGMMHLPGAVHAAAHFFVFGCLTVVLTTTIRAPWKRLAFFLVVATLGLGTEVYEAMKDGLGLESLDVVEDVTGSALGLLLGEAVAMAGMYMWRRHRLQTWEHPTGREWAERV